MLTLLILAVAVVYIGIGIYIFGNYKSDPNATRITRYRNLDAFIVGALWIVFALVGVMIELLGWGKKE